MKKISILFAFLLGFSNFITAQNSYSGSVYEENSTTPIPYAIVKVQHKNIGVVSNESGKFNLSNQEIEVNDSINIICLGFKTKTNSVRDWKKDNFIFMEADPILLKEAI